MKTITRHLSIAFVSMAILTGCDSGGGDCPLFLPCKTPRATDASLSSLALNARDPTNVRGVTLNPAFSPSVLNYTATVDLASVDVFATTSDRNASFTINGGTSTNVPLQVGNNTISIVVTAENGTTKRNYIIIVTRASMVVNTTIGWNGKDSLAPFGKGSISTGAFDVFGQTFVAAADAPTLQQLSFWLQHSPNDTSGEDLFFSVVVMAWNTDRATGPVLYESALQNITTAQSMMTEYLVNTGGLILVPGQEYVAFLSANNGFWNTTSTLIDVGFQNADVYSQGAAWILDTDNNLNLVTSAPWMNPSGTPDLVVMFSF